MDTYSESWRCICEARHWLRAYGHNWPLLLEQLSELEKIRGCSQSTLRTEIERQWARKKEWYVAPSA